MFTQPNYHLRAEIGHHCVYDTHISLRTTELIKKPKDIYSGDKTPASEPSLGNEMDNTLEYSPIL